MILTMEERNAFIFVDFLFLGGGGGGGGGVGGGSKLIFQYYPMWFGFNILNSKRRHGFGDLNKGNHIEAKQWINHLFCFSLFPTASAPFSMPKWIYYSPKYLHEITITLIRNS